MSNLKAVVYARLEAIMAAEKITREEMSALSRELLMYVPETQDIDIVNRLIVACTKATAAVATLFFTDFLPWESEKDKHGNHLRFGSKYEGERKVAAKMKKIGDFLADPANNIWTWQDDNVDIAKAKDWSKNVANAVKKALKGDENNPALHPFMVMEAVLSGGMTFDTLLKAVDFHTERQKSMQALLDAAALPVNETTEAKSAPEAQPVKAKKPARVKAAAE